MYESFYALDKPPFENVPAPEFLFPSAQHQRARSTLQYALVARIGFCVVTGDAGTGKTTTVRRVLQTVDRETCVGLVSNTHCETFEELMRWILLAFDLDYENLDKVKMYDEFVQFLIGQYQSGQPVTLIIDEAQNLGLDNLEQLRMLSNVNTEKGQILQTILVGQPELWNMLREPNMKQFVQRISYDCELRPFADAGLTREYIEHRVRTAGGPEGLFQDDTFELIFAATGGVPRLINLICDTALIYGFGESESSISAGTIRQVIEDKQANFNLTGAGGADSPTGIPNQAELGSIDLSDKSARRKRTVHLRPDSARPEDEGKLSTIERAALRRKERS